MADMSAGGMRVGPYGLWHIEPAMLRRTPICNVAAAPRTACLQATSTS